MMCAPILERRARARRQARPATGDGFTLIELLVVVSVIGVIAAIAIPQLLRARVMANETSAIGSMRSVSSAQIAYATSCGFGSYATGLLVLAVPPGGAGGPFLPPDMTQAATVTKSGFWVTVNTGGYPAGPIDCNGTPTSVGYYASATPVMHGVSGRRAFAVNQAGVIYFVDGPAAPNPPGAGSPVQ